MMLMIKTLLYVIFPGIAGFMASQAIIIPQVIAWTVGFPGTMLVCIAATGLLTFAFAAIFRGWSIRLTRRFVADPAST